MPKILCYLPTYSPYTEASTEHPRSYSRLNNDQISERLKSENGRIKPWVYFDAIDSILNTRPDVHLVVGDGRSTDSIRNALIMHHKEAYLEHYETNLYQRTNVPSAYTLETYPEKMSQWVIFNDILKKYSTSETEYFIYSSCDVIWLKDWIAEAIKEFERNPKLMIAFPCVNNGDSNLPCQVASGPRDIDAMKAPYQEAAKAPVLNAYAMIFRMEFLHTYGGYPTIFRNCYTESFLHCMCEAMGGEMLLLPRCWCFHWGTVDIWQENGSYYHYNEDIAPFNQIMNSVKMAQAVGALTPDLLKSLLYKKETV